VKVSHLRMRVTFGEIPRPGASYFAHDGKVSKTPFRGFATKYPFCLEKQSDSRSPYAAFRFDKRRALRVGGAVFQTGHLVDADCISLAAAFCKSHFSLISSHLLSGSNPLRFRLIRLLRSVRPLGVCQHNRPFYCVGAVGQGQRTDSFTDVALSEAGCAWQMLESVQSCKRRS